MTDWPKLYALCRGQKPTDKPTDWPDLKPNDLVLYQNDVTRPCRLVLSKFADGYGIRVDTPLFDSRVAPAITRSELIDIAIKMIRATR